MRPQDRLADAFADGAYARRAGSAAGERSPMEFDYIIVGAGTAGSVLAARLSQDGSHRVLLLEAGGADRGILINVPLAFPRISANRLFDWGYSSEPEPTLDGRRIAVPRGKVLGGCSSINGMVHVRGNPGDFDRWAANGAPGWSWRDVLPYFRKLENWQGEPSQTRGATGPTDVRQCGYKDPLSAAFAAATAANGLPANADYNDGEQFGYTPVQQAIRDGRRCSASLAYLKPARSRKNLKVETGALVERVVIENGRATGVAWRRGGERRIATARAEVILAAGAINSPHLLMLSGIGPAAELAGQGIGTLVDAPQVGRNLQDHVVTLLEYERLDDGPFMRELRWDRLLANTFRAYFAGTGPASDIPSCGLGFARVDADSPVPQVQFLFRAASRLAQPWLPGLIPMSPNRFGCSVWLLHPRSRGWLSLASPDPEKAIRIHENFLAEDEDRRIMREGIRLGRRIVADAAFEGFRGEEELPGKAADSDAELDAYLRRSVNSAHHPAGTCRMGSDAASVVDPQLRVRGVAGLRVVDASVMPDHVSGNTNAPVLMIAERAADLIAGRA